jgi:hypothetical protein
VDGGDRQVLLMHAPEPDPRAGSAVAQLTPGMLDQLNHIVGDAPLLLGRVSRDEPRDALSLQAIAPFPDRL